MAHTVDRNYQSKARKPADFNAFWEDVLEDAAKSIKLVKISSRTSGIPDKSSAS